jgi:hypothetical protein
MSDKHDPIREAQEFAEDLEAIKSRAKANSQSFKDMPLEGKRKCMGDLDDAIQTLQRIKKNLKKADDQAQDELEESKEKSEGRVKKLKFKISDFIRDLPADKFPCLKRSCTGRELLTAAGIQIVGVYREKKIKYNCSTKQDIINGLLSRPDLPSEIAGELMAEL